jgi:hypothetical protein
MPMPKHSPLPTTDLNSVEAWPFAEGVDQIVLRVSRYEEDGTTPAAFQAVVTGRDPRRGSIGILANPVSALSWAIDMFFDPRSAPPEKAKADQEIADLLE